MKNKSNIVNKLSFILFFSTPLFILITASITTDLRSGAHFIIVPLLFATFYIFFNLYFKLFKLQQKAATQ
ncbi:hypothetical protein Q9251_00335 [Alkalihalobacillus macyae]|uniref:hypothetical protein n=1 Tax=Guptibacillus hwajinpoensis TaxID=208199 RepID=UPI00273B2A39|nr:hypothetical protein [Alkalihalobacillus macyae]MDP4549321.1 hypothetical protein [Alkalihalobacillus macyae]